MHVAARTKLRRLFDLSTNVNRFGRKIRLFCVFLHFPDMSISKSATRGRPKSSLVGRLRTQMWAHHVMALSGAKTVKVFEDRFLIGSKLGLSKGLWSRYLRGEVTPQAALDTRSTSLIHRLEAVFPGAHGTFFHPIWELMDFDILLGPDDIKKIYQGMGEHICDEFFYSEDTQADLPEFDYIKFWHRPLEVMSAQDAELYFYDFVSLDGIALCIAEARMAHLRQNDLMFCYWMELAGVNLRSWRHPHLPNRVRMRSALLVMEGILINYALQMTKYGEGIHLNRTERMKKIFTWNDFWLSRCKEHIRKLSPSLLKQFLVWNNPDIDVPSLFDFGHVMSD